MPSIKFINGPKANQRFVLNGGEICGRDPASEIQVFAPGVSRRHCQIIQESGRFAVCDLGSMNHTYVNKAIIARTELRDGDLISVGGIHMEYVEDEGVIHDALNDTSEHKVESVDAIDADVMFRSSADTHMASRDDLSKEVEVLERRLRIFYEVSQSLGTVQNSLELLNRIMVKLFEAFSQVDRGVVMIGDSFETLIPRVVHYRDDSENSTVPVSRALGAKVFLERQAILARNIDELEGPSSDTFSQFHQRSVMCAPLLFHSDCMGYIQLDSKGNDRFSKEDLRLLTGIAGQAGVFLKNAKLFRLTNLERYFSDDLARRVIDGEIDLNPGGALRQGTVFFSDIIGFTGLSEKLGPHQVISLMNRYFEIMVNIILKYRGYIDKFIGDAIMAIWGAPAEVEDEVLSSLRAAVDMQNALYLFNCELVSELGSRGVGETLDMAIGINTGPFIAGNLGSERRMEYTVIGDAVNLAQRVESKATVGTIYVSDSTHDAADGPLLACRLRPVQLKGKARPVTIYSVRGVPSEERGLFLTSFPMVAFDPVEQDGLLVKAKLQSSGSILGQILLREAPVARRFELIFTLQEAPTFRAIFEVQRAVPLREANGVCLNGLVEARGTLLEEMLREGIYVSPKSPDDIERDTKPFAWEF